MSKLKIHEIHSLKEDSILSELQRKNSYAVNKLLQSNNSNNLLRSHNKLSTIQTLQEIDNRKYSHLKPLVKSQTKQNIVKKLLIEGNKDNKIHMDLLYNNMKTFKNKSKHKDFHDANNIKHITNFNESDGIFQSPKLNLSNSRFNFCSPNQSKIFMLTKKKSTKKICNVDKEHRFNTQKQNNDILAKLNEQGIKLKKVHPKLITNNRYNETQSNSLNFNKVNNNITEISPLNNKYVKTLKVKSQNFCSNKNQSSNPNLNRESIEKNVNKLTIKKFSPLPNSEKKDNEPNISEKELIILDKNISTQALKFKISESSIEINNNEEEKAPLTNIITKSPFIKKNKQINIKDIKDNKDDKNSSRESEKRCKSLTSKKNKSLKKPKKRNKGILCCF